MKTASHRSLKKVSQLVDTARDLFYRHGVKRVTIEEVCRISGVSKVTFYKYFKNKKALATHIRSDLMMRGFSKLDEISAMDLPYPRKAEKMVQWRVKFFAKMSRDFIEEMFSGDIFRQRVKQRILNTIATAQRTGEIRPDLSPELIWLAMEKLAEITTEGSWRRAFTSFGKYQDQINVLFYSGVLSQNDPQ